LFYAEFISLKETRKSIHRIINMSVRNSHKLVFQIFDKNKNGIIDEEDLIQLVNLSENLTGF
jgi:Ca2+-binding EF-hand superfamily protein